MKVDRLTLLAGVVVMGATCGGLTLTGGVAGGIVGLMVAMAPGDPVAVVAVEGAGPTALEWTAGEFAQEVWLEVELTHSHESPYVYGPMDVDGDDRELAFGAGGGPLKGDGTRMTWFWTEDMASLQGHIRVTKLEPVAPGTERRVAVQPNLGDGVQVHTMNLYVVDCTNWSCNPDRLF